MSQPKFSFTTTAEEAADALANEIKGKNVLITGTSAGGIGFETALAIAKYANFVIITGHSSERLKIAEAAIRKQVPSANIRPLGFDLSSLADVRRAAEEVNAYPEPLHVIIHNAAAAVGPFKLTADNLESQIQTNHISPFLLTQLLAPKILAARMAEYTPRVIFVSSAGHAMSDGVNFETLGKPDPESYKGMDTYNSTKTANILSGIELSKRSKGQINAYSLHPGVIFTNGMKKEELRKQLQALGVLDADGNPTNDKFLFKTLQQGGATTVAAAFDPTLNEKPGAYLVDSVVDNTAVAPHSSDPANAEKLWTLTEKIVGETFVF
ncbi:hypothetical protein B0H19DRAFT_1318318 [Mycena capillaripes]|nr:hypothetical protein B0H19DRAFT_1318318 [Mycena capillaripes]